jgi:hypothetical protein
MELSELESSLEIIFEKEIHDLESGAPTFKIESSENGDILKYPNADMMINLFSLIQSDGKLRLSFVDSLEKKIKYSDEFIRFMPSIGTFYVGISGVCFYTLVVLGFVNEAVNSLKRRTKGSQAIYNLISYLIPNNYFDLNQQNEVLQIIRADPRPSDIKSRLNSILVKSRFELLGTQIRRVNIETNLDKKAVCEKISLLGFDKSYSQLLDGIDSFINTETLKEVKPEPISTLRVFMTNLQKDIATKIADKEGETIPAIGDQEEMGTVGCYLKKKLDLSDSDDRFIGSFVGVLHSEGGNAFVSEKEYFRLARNIAIEIALFLLSKYEKKFKS